MWTETTKASEAITQDRDSLGSRKMPDSTGLAFIDDAALLSERASVREALQHEPAKKAELAKIYDALTAELDQRAAQAWAKNYEPRQELEQVDRAPADMSTWELITTYRHAWTLAYYRPRGYLAKALANWLLVSQRELESRGAWVAEIMPPHSM
jgi:hypothetical protein